MGDHPPGEPLAEGRALRPRLGPAQPDLGGETLRLRASLLAEDGEEELCGASEGTGPSAGTDLAADLLGRAPPAIRRLFAG